MEWASQELQDHARAYLTPMASVAEWEGAGIAGPAVPRGICVCSDQLEGQTHSGEQGSPVALSHQLCLQPTVSECHLWAWHRRARGFPLQPASQSCPSQPRQTQASYVCMCTDIAGGSREIKMTSSGIGPQAPLY